MPLAIWPLVTLASGGGDPSELALALETRRLWAYIASAGFLWFIFVLVWAAQKFNHESLRRLGFNKLKWADGAIAIAFMLGANLALNGLSWILKQAGLEIPEMVVEALMPQTTTEKLGWIGLSITAGVCEETCFRGFLLVQGRQIWQSWLVAGVISSAVFGIAHMYQSWAGVALIGVYGLFFCWLRVRTGSLWPCILAHTMQDVGVMFLGPFQDF